MIPISLSVNYLFYAYSGKKPKRAAATAETQAEMIQLRREMEEAVEREDYELASEIRYLLAMAVGEPGSKPVTLSPSARHRAVDRALEIIHANDGLIEPAQCRKLPA